jgi:integrase
LASAPRARVGANFEARARAARAREASHQAKGPHAAEHAHAPLLVLEWGDLDLHNHQVIFRRASSRGVVGPTKSGKGRRVPMTERLHETLKAVRHLRGGLVFCQPNGKPLDAWRLTRLLDRASKRAGLRQIRRHDCRHWFASQLLIGGVPLPQVQAWLGHSTIAMTMRYAHLAPGHGADLIGVLEAPLRQPDGNRDRRLS